MGMMRKLAVHYLLQRQLQSLVFHNQSILEEEENEKKERERERKRERLEETSRSDKDNKQ
jgi:hypothetical protein